MLCLAVFLWRVAFRLTPGVQGGTGEPASPRGVLEFLGHQQDRSPGSFGDTRPCGAKGRGAGGLPSRSPTNAIVSCAREQTDGSPSGSRAPS